MNKLQLTWLNGFWLVVPALLWNLVFASQLPQEIFSSDEGIPGWLLAAEGVLRIAVFAGPLLLHLRWESPLSRAGWILFVLGTLVYFASWLPLMNTPDSAWSQSSLGILAPYFTPLLFFLGMAMIGESWPFALAAVVFTAVHTSHGLYALKLI